MNRLPSLDIAFDDVGHIYTIDGIRMPSVTQIMEPMSLMLYRDVPADVLFSAANRGTRAHEQISNFVLYGIQEVDEDTRPYIEAFAEFEAAYSPTWIGSEYRIYHKALRYAGTIDLIGHIYPDDGTGVDVVDIKCTAVYHPVMLATQLSGYCEALKSHGVSVRKMYGLQLQKSGKYRFEQVSDGYKTFLHCLAIYNAMTQERKP